MAKDFMAQMLDELMGRNRNAAPNERQELQWDDETVSEIYIVLLVSVVTKFSCRFANIILPVTALTSCF